MSSCVNKKKYQKKGNEILKKRKNNFNLNQKSFYFEKYIDSDLEKRKKSFIWKQTGQIKTK